MAEESHSRFTQGLIQTPTQEEAILIEKRHEELKKQIALKETQLADMTGERDTVNILRSRLGLEKNFVPGSAFRNLVQEEQQSRTDIIDSSRQRGQYSSTSPQNQNRFNERQEFQGASTTSHMRGKS